MTPANRLQEIAFDLYERYILLEQIGNFFRPSETVYRVLDVGGHTPAFWQGFRSLAASLIPDAKVAVVDVLSAADLKNYIQGSGAQLPFRDQAFDLVCSLDTLEHVPAASRPTFLSELLRVTKNGLYIAFPFDSPSNLWAESLVTEYTGVRLNVPVPALLEHRQFGLPDRDFVSDILSRTAHSWITFGQGNTDVWLLMMLTYHSLRKPGTDFVQELNRRFNLTYAAQDWAEPHYRAGYVLSKCRSHADLASLLSSFTSHVNHADLQSVLSFCQLYLNIAQNARVTVDKDRHIRNINHDLGEARVYREKWGEAARVLRDLEVHLLDTPPDDAGDLPANWPEPRKSQLLDAAVKLRTGVQSETDRKLSQLAGELEIIREQIDGLAHRLEYHQTQLDNRTRDVEIGLVTNKRAIQAIYDSRIWKALCSFGGLLLRLTGRPVEPEPGPVWAPPMEAHTWIPEARPDRNSTEEFVGFVCDYPGQQRVLPVRDIVEIRGWVLARSGIERVAIRINEDTPVSSTYGIPRPDVARSHPEFLDAGQSGYRFFWDTSGMPEGPCTVRITAIARNGQTKEIVCKVAVDFKTTPDYGLWITRHEPTLEAVRQIRESTGNLAVRPCISVAVPVYRTPSSLITRCIESVIEQTYPNWELCLADDGSHDAELTALLRRYMQRDSRIRVTALAQNRGISEATNTALRLGAGEYVAFLDHDDELAAFALAEVVRAINDHPDIELFYSDEDKIDERGRRYDPFFKPDWSPDLFRSCNYICHFVVLKRSLLDQIGGLDEKYNGAQDYEFLLRASERTQRIKRIPKILYHWRAITGSAAKNTTEKPEASADGERGLSAYLDRAAPGAHVEEVSACRYRVRYPITGNPRVSILIPTGGHKNVFRALDDVLEKTEYKNYDVVLIDNSRDTRVQEHAALLAARKAPVQYFDWRGKPFNFAQMNNEAARGTASPYLLFLNDDTTVISPGWLAAMLEHAQRPEVGAVGAQLWYPNNLIQHAGVVMGIFGNCSHAFKGLPGGQPHYFDFPNLIRNCSAVTGACLLLARDKFFEAGAFDEINLAVAFQDVDLCLKLLELGYRNVYTPYARLYHYESATKTDKDKIPDPAEDAFMKKKWAKYIADDPYYNPNLARRKEDFSVALD